MKKFILSIALLLGLVGMYQMAAQNLVPVPLKMQNLTTEQPLVWMNVGAVSCPDELANEKEHLMRILDERAGVKGLNL